MREKLNKLLNIFVDKNGISDMIQHKSHKEQNIIQLIKYKDIGKSHLENIVSTDQFFQSTLVLNVHTLFFKHSVLFKYICSIFSPIMHTFSTAYEAVCCAK